MAKQRGLGKGLSVLIPTGAPEVEEAPTHTPQPPVEQRFLLVAECDSLSPNPFQPRHTIEEDSLENLAASIKEHGVIQPILVRHSQMGYQIVAGERRWRAAQLAGLLEVPIRVLDLSDAQAMELALVENLQREDLSTIEIAQGIQDLITRLSLTHEEAAQKIGLSRTAVTNKLRLLQLPKEVLNMLESGEITEGHGRALLALPNTDKMVELAELVIKSGLNVRQLEEMVRNLPLTAKLDAAFPTKPAPRSEFDDEIALLSANYNLNIKVAGNKKNMGLVIKGLKKWQLHLLFEYLEQHSEELFPRE
ncbi:MAG: ParB/RepB/Spo0J family partition protein [Synergistaceae bacterium]|jgi:ParB family chromosome partitioning protein|nr:ParB/RepB/Spo0J family partition protein [Synergistaceae bacterium]